ncbi:MAG: molybdenum cofactor biosynthesis protein [Thermotoga sp.]|nr:MAG: molybdenum cofactor biosynthesis protein [Thermotoga sp.]
MIKVAILTISDKCSAGEREDESGKIIDEMIQEIGAKKVYYDVIPDDFEKIKEVLYNISEKGIADLILTTGGTGFAPRDVTPEATMSVIEKEAPGLVELIRWETVKITPQASLSRARAGIRKSTLIVNLPGSPRAVKECLGVILHVLPHGIDILKGTITEH